MNDPVDVLIIGAGASGAAGMEVPRPECTFSASNEAAGRTPNGYLHALRPAKT
jgi:hypothetical protein